MHKQIRIFLRSKKLVLLGVVVVVCLSILMFTAHMLFASKRSRDPDPWINQPNVEIPRETKLTTHIMLSSLNKPWDVVFADGKMIVSENDGAISLALEGKKYPILNVPNVDDTGEGGLMGMAVDPEFSGNHFIYACYNTKDDIRVSRWKLNDTASIMSDQKDIITGIATNAGANPGRHSGCRIEFGPDGYLWVGTGDVAIGTTSQDPKSLGGKILRVDRDGAAAASGNLGAPFDTRIYSYGHRNTQGIAFAKNAQYLGISTEHGPNVNDELNLLKPGNFGWNPVPGYNESVSMTDTAHYPDAVKEIWASGSSTLAPSGASFVYGDNWREYNGTLFVAILKGQQVKVFTLKDDGSVESEKTIFSKQFGRIRTVRQGPDGGLYLTTDNGNDQDVIVHILPE